MCACDRRVRLVVGCAQCVQGVVPQWPDDAERSEVPLAKWRVPMTYEWCGALVDAQWLLHHMI